MELTAILKAAGAMVATGNYLGALVFVIACAGFIFIWRKLQSIEVRQKLVKPKTNYNKFIEEDSVVVDDLDFIRQKYHADRAIVLELRNGEVNVANIPSMKVYIRNEQLRPSIRTMSKLVNGIPASFYSRPLRKLVKGLPFKLDSIDEIKDSDFGLYQNLVAADVKSTYTMPLADTSGALYGALVLEYCNDESTLNDVDMANFAKDAARLNGEILVMKKAKEGYS